MTIYKTDIKLMQSKRLTDNDDGGGVVTSLEVQDGVVNNLFSDISRLDRTVGRVSLRKAFLAVDTNNSDVYYGAHLIISQPQNDPAVDLLIMTTKDPFDQRLEAQAAIQTPINISDSFDSDWAVFSLGPLQNQATFSPEGAGAYVPSTFPWNSTPSEIQINGSSYDGSIDYPENRSFTQMQLTLSVPLLSNVAIDTPVFNSQAETRWKTEIAALAGDTVVFLKHDTYFPGVGDFVVLYDQALSVQSIDSSVWYRPVYTFSDAINSAQNGSDNLKKLNESQNNSDNKYYGVTTLAADGVASESQITVTETDKLIFPIGSENLDPELIGLDPNSLPPGKRVNIIEQTYVIVIHRTVTEVLTNPVVLGNTYSLTGTDYQLIELIDSNDVQVNPALYTVDLVLGELTINGAADLSPYTQPLTANKRYEDMRLVTDVDYATKIVTLGRPLSQNFLAADTFISSAMIFGDLAVSYTNFFDQQTWTDIWQDTVIGSHSIATYNDVAYPVLLTNASAITERWALIFTGTTTFDIVGENVGLIGTGQTDGAPGTFIAPVNIETSLTYWQLAQEGFGAGWSVGNVIRFNTVALSQSTWFIRVTQQSDDTLALTDEFTVQIRGDAN